MIDLITLDHLTIQANCNYTLYIINYYYIKKKNQIWYGREKIIFIHHFGYLLFL